MKIRYSYKEYKDHPEATEISKMRGIGFTFYSIALGFGILISIALLITDFLENWYIGIPGIILCLAGFVYLVTQYDKVTERKIAKSINEKNRIEQEKIDEEYACLYIYRLDSYKSGHCGKCGKHSANLRECAVKDRYGEDAVYLCDSCIARYMRNKK